MANITETSNWETGVYQFETTDPIQGGADGVDNLPHKQLGNRTLWLKAQVDALNALKGKTIPEFSAVTAYASGEIVSYGGNIYRANAALAAAAWNASNWTALVYSVDATKLNGQLPAYYLDLTNATGTLASARLTGTYAISVSGNAATATTLQTARTITLGGDLSGSASFNGSANITITATVADSSHLHDYSNLLNAPVKDSVLVATTAALTVTYANGTSGVGATLTNSGTLAALVIDGVALAVNDRVLVKNQAAPAQNGIYTVTNIGSASVAWVMTRGTNADTNAELAGCLVCVDRGTVNGGFTYKTTFKSTDTVGTTACVWTPLATTDSSITGNASTATKLQTARTINGVSFDGSANITIADATKLPLTGGNLSGGVNITTAATIHTLSTAQATLSGSNDAIMCFNRPGLFTAGFGVDANNVLVYGGNNSSLGTTHKVWHDGVAGKSFSANGYQKLPSGAILQWGALTLTSDDLIVTFPVAFPTLCAAVQVTSDQFVESIVGCAGRSTTNFVAQGYDSGTNFNSTTPGNVIVTWFAIGY